MAKEIMDTIDTRSIGAAAEAKYRFEGGSARHKAAMAGFPDSRRLEVALLRYLLPERRGCVMDLFAGTGFASSSISRFFDDVVLLDPHVEPAAASGGGARRYHACALSASSFKSVREADLAVCLAGFHHVLGAGSSDDKKSHRRQRSEALRLWRSKLSSGGRLVIADVPAPGTATGWADGPLDGLPDAPELEKDGGICSIIDDSDVFAHALGCPRLRDCLARVTSLCQELGVDEAEPATFFDQVVSVLSPYGHVACFNTPLELADLFRVAGFENVRAFVASTPWQFQTRADALWFVHELLGIGQPCASGKELPADERELVEAGISAHLGLRQLPDGSWAVAWKLMYVMGDRP